MSDTKPDYRLVNEPLMVGLMAMPMLFVWLLFRRGYAPSLRWIVIIYAFMPLVLQLIHSVMLDLLWELG
ncbi:MAG: hypothetical protein C0476_09840 [Sphingomonas sp.]|nr:hypothetical protein [Sphingomonas sp.]